MYRGSIVRLISDKRFGFIRLDGSRDEYFFHLTGIIDGTRWEDLKIGTQVEFDPEDSAKGLRATNICVHSL